MKIFIPLEEKKENSYVGERFARSMYFAIYNTDTNEYEIIKNPFYNDDHGVGIKVASFIAEKSIDVAVAYHFGPKVSDLLKEFGVKMFQLDSSKKYTINDVVDVIKNG